MNENTASMAEILADLLKLSSDAMASVSEREQLSIAVESLVMSTEHARRARDQIAIALLELEEYRRQNRRLVETCRKWEAIANGLLARLIMVTRPPEHSKRMH
ncbi:hypothetical protein [Methylococcus capsulatus]|uniref:hypothetical protein n=2 Tax=Methylococcus capsulatus TaxID=414 RepID=UPI001C52BABE|nr:hypothetical protein [Methylococcus capsulatus]QXP88549.1 hypothetical protein KW112_05370 [Methylococcus capsulatus]QXP94437.1 hypothetical protein KW113_04360 [Methylococcus capsulatus]